MDSLAVIPALYIFKDCLAGLFGILISMKINFFLFQYGMERFDTGIIVWISFTAGMNAGFLSCSGSLQMPGSYTGFQGHYEG
jgi:hypothetical protein